MSFNNRRKVVGVVANVLVALLVVVGVAWAAVVPVDTFDQGEHSLAASAGTSRQASSVGPYNADILGGYRDAEVNFNSGSGDLKLLIDTTEYPDAASLSVGPNAVGTAKITWDGVSDADTFTPTGLGNKNLLDGSNAGIYVRLTYLDRTATLRLTGYEDGSNHEYLEYTVNQAARTINRLDLFYPFDAFESHKTGNGADWTSLGALTLDISGDSALDLTVDFMDARNAPRDYGDLPDGTGGTPNYGSVLGVYHVPGGLTLGDNLDSDAGAQPSTDALGDDSGAFDDEDGASPLYYRPSGPTYHWGAAVTVNGCPDTDCYLSGWIDLDGNGHFEESEKFTYDDPGGNSTLSGQYSIAPASTLPEGYYYLRFRVCDEAGECDDPGECDEGECDVVATNGEVEDYRWYFGPTSVDMASFTASWRGDTVSVQWQTASETDLKGFNVLRSEAPEAADVQLNGETIAPQTPGSLTGNAYEYVDDTTVKGTTYYYWLEALNVDAPNTWYGPIPATVKIYLPLVTR